MSSDHLTYRGPGGVPRSTPHSPRAIHPLLARAYDLWESLPDDLPLGTYTRILTGTNECLEAGDRAALESLYATARVMAVAA